MTTTSAHIQTSEVDLLEENCLSVRSSRSGSWITALPRSCKETWRLESGTSHVSVASNISQLHSNYNFESSESVQSFETLCTMSERSLTMNVPCLAADPKSEDSMEVKVVPRRASCPSVLEISTISSVRECVEPVRYRGLSSSLDKAEAKLSQDERRARIKESLSKLSASIVSASRCLRNSTDPSRLSDATLSPVGSPRKNPDNSPCSTHQREKSSIPQHLDPQYTVHSDELSPIAKDASDARLPVTVPSNLRPHFAPSPVGTSLMRLFTQDAPQEPMWSAFVAKAAGPREWADSASKMPAVVFCLRGLIRFGTGEYGVSRRDALQWIFAILVGRHEVADSPSLAEAVECSAAVLAMLAVNPVSRSGDFNSFRSRASFEPLMVAQNGALFQQLIMCLTKTIPRCLELNRETTRAVSALLEVALVYCNNPQLRASWLGPAPSHFKTSVTMLLASIPQRFPSLTTRALAVLEALLEGLGGDLELARQVALTLHAAIQRMPPHVAGEAMHLIRRWAGPTPKSGGSIGRFLKSLGGGTTQSTLKSTVYAQYQTLH